MHQEVSHRHRLSAPVLDRIAQLSHGSDAKPQLDYLSRALFDNESETSAVAACFQPLLPDLLIRGSKKASLRQSFIALSQLVGWHDVASHFSRSFFSGVAQELPVLCISANYLTEDVVPILRAGLTFLWYDRQFYSRAFDWTPVLAFESSADATVCWLAAHCSRILTSSGEDVEQQLCVRFPSTDFSLIRLNFHSVFTRRSSYFPPCHLSAALLQKITADDLCPNIVNVNGVLLQRVEQRHASTAAVVVTDRFRRLLSMLATCAQVAIPAVVRGAVGSGKTCLVEHLAFLTGRTGSPALTKVQLGDQVDGKLLVGGYHVTDTPGEFAWRAGPLTSAMLTGDWILFEDIDSVAPDVTTILLTALKSQNVSSLPGCTITGAKHPEFRIFFTQRTERLTDKLPAELTRVTRAIAVTAPENEELSQILSQSFPSLKPIVPGIIETFRLAAGSQDSETITGRRVTLRDLMKWCRRLVLYFDSVSTRAAEAALKDAIDCFVPDPRLDSTKVQALGTHLNLSKAEAVRLVMDDFSTPQAIRDSFRIGRISLSVVHRDILSSENRRMSDSFAFTPHSLRLLERVAAAVHANEPVLLVGETGTGKTSSVQFLARELGRDLLVVNLNQQTDSCDLIGGYKPTNISIAFSPLVHNFCGLVDQSFPDTDNSAFLEKVYSCLTAKKFAMLEQVIVGTRAKVGRRKDTFLHGKWDELVSKVKMLAAGAHQKNEKQGMVFSFIEGSLVKAMREGHWILMDEINLAESEALQSLSHVLDSNDQSVVLLDKADGTPVRKHDSFRIFACMNPATDVGKKDLPLGIRNRFTEIHVDEILEERDLRILVKAYLPVSDKIENIVQFYLKLRIKSLTLLTDTSGRRPHFSLRTLCRALTIVTKNACQDANRSLFEAFSLSFLTQLDSASAAVVRDMISDELIGGPIAVKAVIGKEIPRPVPESVSVEGYWIPVGPNERQVSDKYILTPSIRNNLKNLSRIVSLGETLPVLLQGDTGVGKTSLIQWIAKATGNTCLRVNNHEHTDLEEYIGSYCSDENGNLVFREGVLIQAMRKGQWIILDELNLAPTEILEALNRVLDDNRELFIPETQTTVKAHPNFILFATQNPPGLYGGRKVLSRAFRNRFVELHFDEIPSAELIVIMEKRCLIPASYARKMVLTMTHLQRNRRGSEIFAGKSGFIALRELFRWGDRFRISSQHVNEKFFDWDLFLAELGFLVIAGKVRSQEEEELIRQTLEKTFLKKGQCLHVDEIYHRLHHEFLSGPCPPQQFMHIVATGPFRRLVALVWSALKFGEPVLLVGETGCGKTSICQLYAAVTGVDLKTVNCHMHSEGSDFIGNLRPVRAPVPGGPLFEWVNGPLVDALHSGCVFLMDEISLADDSVLERLNSVLEPERRLLLTEKGMEGTDAASITIQAQESFRFVATMNPGGDYGKKELSPALRNRFTEIWCPSTTSCDDLQRIVRHNLDDRLQEESERIAYVVSRFYSLFRTEVSASKVCSVRDVMTWVAFINVVTQDSNGTCLTVPDSVVHGAEMVFIDALGCGDFTMTQDSSLLSQLKTTCLTMIRQLTESSFGQTADVNSVLLVSQSPVAFKVGPFAIERLPAADDAQHFTFQSDGVRRNAMKVLRGMQLMKPVLLEGAPGVGKTSLIQAIAEQTGHQIVRINLSEQTDISDLFGSDLPAEGDSSGGFQWRDGPLLQALQTPDTWVVLDELNLASQSVLEGLNACLDHRGEVFVAELGKTFDVNSSGTRIFGCQNPYREGGDRKGLPKSFLNRFTMVHVHPFAHKDLIQITTKMFPQMDDGIIDRLVRFNQTLFEKKSEHRFTGPDWEWNLRDVTRCCHLLSSSVCPDGGTSLAEAVRIVYWDRLRTVEDQGIVSSAFENVFGHVLPVNFPDLLVTSKLLHAGTAILQRKCIPPETASLSLSPSEIPALRSLMSCVQNNWMSILVSENSDRASNVVRVLSALTGSPLRSHAVTPQTDATELLGGFEQRDLNRQLNRLEEAVRSQVERQSSTASTNTCIRLIRDWNNYCKLNSSVGTDSKTSFLAKVDILLRMTTSSGGPDCEYLHRQVQQLHVVVNESKDLRSSGAFEWMDSQLIVAMEKGHWLLVEDANLCPPSVLDRLNSLFEPNGRIVMTEQGSVDGCLRVLTPHPDFRFFMTMDPTKGELSRAMRNRGVEYFIGNCPDAETVIDISAVVADPLISRLSRFPASPVSNSGEQDESGLFSRLIGRILLQCSSALDYKLRIRCVGDAILPADVDPNEFFSAVKAEFPIDCRNMLINFQDQLPDAALNNWLLRLHAAFHASSVNLTDETSLSSLSLTDDQFIAVRLFSHLNIGPSPSHAIIRFVKHRFLSRLASAVPHLCIRPDAEAVRAEQWSSMMRHLSSDVCLTRTEMQSRSTAAALNLMASWRRIAPNSARKHLLRQKLTQFFETVVCRDACENGTLQALEQVRQSATDLPLGSTSDHEPCQEPESEIFGKLFVLLEAVAVGSDRVLPFFTDSVLTNLLLDKVDISPLHYFFAQKSGCQTEKLFHFMEDSFSILKVDASSTPGRTSAISRNLTQILISRLCDQRSSLSTSSSQTSVMRDLSDLLLHCLCSGTPFSLPAAMARVADYLEQLLLAAVTSESSELSVDELGLLHQTPRDTPFTDTLSPALAFAAHTLRIGLASAMFLMPKHAVDAVEITACEVTHLKSQLQVISAELDITAAVMVTERGVHHGLFANEHPHTTLLRAKQKELVLEVTELERSLTYRPGSYDRLHRSVLSFAHTEMSKIQSLTKDVSAEKRMCDKYLLQLETSRKSVLNFATKIMSEFFDYADIVTPFASSLFLIESGLRMLIESHSSRGIGTRRNELSAVKKFVSENCNFFGSDLTASGRFLTSDGNDVNMTAVATRGSAAKLRMAAMIDLCTQAEMRGAADADLCLLFNNIIRNFVSDWNAQQGAEEAERKMREATIHCQTFENKCNAEQQEEEELLALFPSYVASFDNLDTGLIPSVTTAVTAVPRTDFSLQVVRLHRHFFMQSGSSDLLTPFQLRYEILAQICDTDPTLLSDVDHEKLIPMHVIMSRNLESKSKCQSNAEAVLFDVYHDYDEHESDRCRKMLLGFKSSVESILISCPEHPVLLRLHKVVERMLGFSVTSPLIKLLTGVELLLSHAQDWQKVYASKDFKITDHLEQMSNLIIDWRKRELSQWSTCLDHVRRETWDKDCTEWWFYLFRLVEEFDNSASDGVVDVLTKFIESSTIGQFAGRLEMLSIFAAQTKVTARSQRLLNILNNVHDFYEQFVDPVSIFHDKERKPIEKDVKDFVKVQRWNDFNFWSLKASVDKSHKFLNRQMKKYACLLSKPITPLLSTDESQSTTEQRLVLNPPELRANTDFTEDSMQVLLPISANPVLLITNMRRFSQKIADSMWKLQTPIDDEEESIVSIISEVHTLQNLKLELSADASPDQRKKAVHHMNNRKRKALSNLFKFLTAEGLLWTSGLQTMQTFSINQMFADLSQVLVTGLDTSCNKFFFSSIARLSQLRSGLQHPSKELPVPDLDRIRGFSWNMIQVFVTGRKSLADQTSALVDSRKILQSLRDCRLESGTDPAVTTRFKILMHKVNYLFGETVRCDSQFFKTSTADMDKIIEIAKSSVTSEVSMHVISESLGKMSPLVQHIHSLAEEVQDLLMSARRSCCPHQTSDENESYTSLTPCILHALKSIERLLKLLDVHPFDSINMRNLMFYDEFWKALNLPQFLTLLSPFSCPDVTSTAAIPEIAIAVMEQYLHLCQSVVSMALEAQRVFGKLIHVLLGIFCRLVRDGYCLPPDMPPEAAGDGTEELTGMGMTDGQGTDDVSDRITSEDQLENAAQEGQNRGDDDEHDDVEEQTGGIEMDGDFDGKNFDVEKETGGEDKDSASDDDVDAEDEVGHGVDGDQQALDKELWEKEVSDDDAVPDEEDDDGRGQDIGQQEIVAKDGGVKDDADTPNQEKKSTDDEDVTQMEPNDENQFDDDYEGEKRDPLKDSDVNALPDSPEQNILPEEMELGHENDGADDGEPAENSETESTKAEDPHQGTEREEEAMEASEENGDHGEKEGEEGGEDVDAEVHEDDANCRNQMDQKQESSQSDLNDGRGSPSSTDVNQRSLQEDRNDSVEQGNPDQNTSQMEDRRQGSGEMGEDSYGDENGDFSSQSSAQPGTSQITGERVPHASHSLAKDFQKPRKRQKVLPSQTEDSNRSERETDVKIDCSLFRHITDEEEADDEVMDEAIRDEAMRRPLSPEDESSHQSEKADAMIGDTLSDPTDNKSADLKFPALRNEGKRTEKRSASGEDGGSGDGRDMSKETIGTHYAARGAETTFHTKSELLSRSGNRDWQELLHSVMAHPDEAPAPQRLAEARLLWSVCSGVVSPLVYELCQQLQLVLEPSKCSKLKGDYRTGKRINMRKVIPYIASQFRKDKIWMRRTKPSKRMYQIVLAVDDSRSMIDNDSKLLAFQSLALLSRSLSLIESGQLSIVSFGETVRQLHPLNQPFSDDVGPKLLTNFSFDQKKTQVSSLLASVSNLFLQSKQVSSASDVSQLLLIMSDGRGVFSDGREHLTSMVRRLNDSGVFCVFVILDSPHNSQSVFDITSVDFRAGKAVRTNYMDEFPFPFYIVLRDITSLPIVLGESLRQWFELLSSRK